MIGNQSRGFIKSSFSTGNGGNCVEWAHTASGVTVRDSKDRSGPELLLSVAEWEGVADAAVRGVPHPAVQLGEHGVRLTGRSGELCFTHSEWHAFAAGARAGEHRRTLDTVR